MAYKNFLLYFNWIDQIVYEIITNQLKPFPVAVLLAHVCSTNLSLYVMTHVPIFQTSFRYNFFSIDFKNMFAKNELSVYIERERI